MMASMKVAHDAPQEIKENEYGYGLQINLNDGQTEALGIKEPIKAGEVVTIKALAFVKRAEQSVEDDGDDKGPDVSLTLQITDMELIHDDGRSQAQKMYSKSGMEP